MDFFCKKHNLAIPSVAVVQAIVFWGLTFSLLVFVLAYDRAEVIDNANYIAYFERGLDNVQRWIDRFSESSLIEGTLSLFSDEIVWLLWTVIVGWVLSPESAVYFTVFSLNFLMALVLSKFRYPFYALLLWLLIPYGFSVVGFYQIRLGFAFSLFMFFSFALKKPLLGLVVAASIHTIFVIPLFGYSIIKIFGTRVAGRFAVFISFTLLAFFGEYLFAEYGGRRALAYRVVEGATSINFFLANSVVFFLVTYLVVSQKIYRRLLSGVSEEYLLMFAGVLSFILISFFVFPLGTSRVGYFLYLLAIPVFCNIDMSVFLRCKYYELGFAAVVLVTIMLFSYLTVKHLVNTNIFLL